MKQIKHITDQNIITELKQFPNQGILWKIIETQATGKIFQLSNNAVVITENCDEPFIFIAGTLTNSSIEKITNFIKTFKFPMIHCNKKYHPLFLHHGWNFHVRTTLNLKTTSSSIITNSNFKILKIDSSDILRKCIKYKELIKIYGNEELFLAHGMGYALFLKNGTLVSESYAALGLGYGEIHVYTHPNYQRKGYGSKIVSHLIKKCRDKNITPQWSCNVDNKPSFKLAMKLGFEILNYHMLLVPNCGNVLCPNLVKWLENNPYP
ncbi:MAG: GNAT family N-acetyltransferase [Rickettsiales bacterium]|nr:GNAT family N-acetyltransferase [Rickettsiales bacterium]